MEEKKYSSTSLCFHGDPDATTQRPARWSWGFRRGSASSAPEVVHYTQPMCRWPVPVLPQVCDPVRLLIHFCFLIPVQAPVPVPVPVCPPVSVSVQWWSFTRLCVLLCDSQFENRCYFYLSSSPVSSFFFSFWDTVRCLRQLVFLIYNLLGWFSDPTLGIVPT